MLRKIVSLTAVLCSLASLAGCAKGAKIDDTVAVTNSVSTVGYNETSSVIHAAKESPVKFDMDDKAPILRNGEFCGYVKVNQIEKLGINDWMNEKCVNANINFSYTINMTVVFTGALPNDGQKTVYCRPCLVEGDNVCGDPCIVGWSGFPESAAISENVRSVSIEYGVQPIKKLSKNTELHLMLYDSDKIAYDTIIMNRSIFKNVKKGPSLITKGTGKVKSVNGGMYSVGVGKAHYEYNYINGDTDSHVRAFEFSYKVSYLKKPKNGRSVSTFDKASGNLLRTKSVIGVQSDASSELMYNDAPYAYRYLYADTGDTVPYVPTSGLKVHNGYYAEYNANRLLSNNATGQPEYLRFRFEFPEEAESRSDKEKLRFSGRFIVVQRKIVERKLYSRNSYDDNGNLLTTSDENAKEDK